MSRGPELMHSQQPPGVVQNWSTLQCSKQNTEQCGYDHAPVTRGRMRAQFPLPHGPPAEQFSSRLGCYLVGFAVLADRWQVILGEFPGRCTQCPRSATTWPVSQGHSVVESRIFPSHVHHWVDAVCFPANCRRVIANHRHPLAASLENIRTLEAFFFCLPFGAPLACEQDTGFCLQQHATISM